jgi:radical SAM protein (TIGR01212 family)
MPSEPTPHRYRHFGSYLRKTYGARVHKITVDAGFTCPNRDGSKGTGGCVYCNNAAFSSHAGSSRPTRPLGEQIESGIEWARRRYQAEKFIVYFQAYTNTYARVEELQELYSKVFAYPDVIGLAIGTRPDSVDSEKISLIAGLVPRLSEVWIEYGLQSCHDETLERINRCDTFSSFEKAVRATAGRGIRICVHVILGLPGETREDMAGTADRLAAFPIDGVKIHLLHVLRGTVLEEWHRKGDVRLLERSEYVGLVCDFLEHLPPHVLVQRLTGEAPSRFLVAPAWCLDKEGVLNDIDRELERRGTRQGWRFPGGPDV